MLYTQREKLLWFLTLCRTARRIETTSSLGSDEAIAHESCASSGRRGDIASDQRTRMMAVMYAG
jgi:hypothetical protein